jgi:tetratricopeptide (TPR) repeat protein
MNDGDPIGAPGPGDGTAQGPDAQDGPEGSDTESPNGSPAGIRPPNLDISPEQARSRLQGHLDDARAMLAAPTPDPEGAIREAKAALAVDGTSIDAIVVIAHASYQKGLYDTAEVILDGLLEKRPSSLTNPYLYYVFGLVYDQTQQPSRAFSAYFKAVELEPNFASALVNLGIHQLTNKQYAGAVTTLGKVSQLGRVNAATLNALGSAFRGMSADFDVSSPARDEWLLKAETTYQKAQAADQDHAPAYYNLGLLYLDADPFPTAQGPMDTLTRLRKAKTYFDEYRNLPGVDVKLYEERSKDVIKLIKREEKKRAKAARESSDAG